MIDTDYVVAMARYNMWQNNALRDIVEMMDDVDLTQDRGAFFGSILGTLNHLLWADQIWMSRFDDGAKPHGGIPESPGLTPTAAVWSAERFRTDGRISLWAEEVRNVDLAGDLTWHSGALGREVTKPMALCVMHMFNLQTHHRGQIHAMMTAAGVETQVTDLFAMPEA